MVFHSSATRKDADSAAVASASVETWRVRFVQPFAALDIILQSLYHALCTFFSAFRAVQMWTSSHIHLILFNFTLRVTIFWF